MPPGRNLTIVTVSQQGDKWTAQLWAQCVPANCDWGAQPIKLMRGGSPLSTDRAVGIWPTKLSMGEFNRYVIFRREGTELVVEHYSDYPNRVGGYVVDRFTREP